LSDASTGGETRDGEAEGCPRREEEIRYRSEVFDAHWMARFSSASLRVTDAVRPRRAGRGAIEAEKKRVGACLGVRVYMSLFSFFFFFHFSFFVCRV